VVCELLLQDPPNPWVSEQAARALGNLTCDNLANATQVVAIGCLPTLAALLLTSALRTKECVAATLHNIAFTGGANRTAVVATKGIVAGLVALLGQGESENSKLQAAAALTSVITVAASRADSQLPANISEADPEAQNEAAQAGVVHVLVQLLGDTQVVNPLSKEYSLMALRAVVFKNSPNLQTLFLAGGLRAVAVQLQHGNSGSQWHAAAVLHYLGAEHEDFRKGVAQALGCQPTQEHIETALRAQISGSA